MSMETQITFDVTAYNGHPSEGKRRSETCYFTNSEADYVQMQIGENFYNIHKKDLRKALTLLQLAAKQQSL